jgi:anthranilate phosphoribosyltransferase
MFTEHLQKISRSENLTSDEAEDAMLNILNGNVTAEEISAFLMGMRMKGESVDELTSFVKIMRSASVSVEVDTDSAVDLCGTGGDRSGTFNISTAAMFIVAGAGVPVLKHGNRSVSSKSGSYDVLEILGAVPNLKKEQVEALYNETGMAFMFAPNFHPALKYVMPARRSLKIRTFFNMLGPLLNPANVKYQVVGAYSKEAAGNMIQILSNLDTENAYTVNAHDGLDEITTTSHSEIFELQSGLSGTSVTFDPRSLDYDLAEPETILGGDAKTNAGILTDIVSNQSTKEQRDIAELNAAFAIHAAKAANSLEEAKNMAAKSIDSGEAKRKLDLFVRESKKIAKAV